MIYSKLPQTDIEVSKICLGTMTFGEQNTQEEAFEQMDYAVSQGINFFDTAELYSVPVLPETYGDTEKIIGNWLKERNNREKIVLASKAVGPGNKHIRGGGRFTREHLEQALDGSLKRLQTDYIDLYQLHWPERHTPRFGGLNYEHKPEIEFTPFEEVLEVLQEFINKGKVRAIGISNETPWGMMKFIECAENNMKQRISTIQNPYSLINRVFEIGNSEICHRENVGLLAYSPLGGGLLSGKYIDNQRPEKSRYTLFPNYFKRYQHENTQKAVEEYTKLANELSIPPSKLALAFINTRDFLTSNIIGATKMSQLKENISSIDVEITKDIEEKINEIHFNFPNPAP
ncbi:MAG: aldo/keto reductase [Flavobacteriales bacterium]|nr:aldo/keto reductase [Flavobacteriales bacterium]